MQVTGRGAVGLRVWLWPWAEGPFGGQALREFKKYSTGYVVVRVPWLVPEGYTLRRVL